MQSSSSLTTYSSESSPVRKNKSQSQREYRSKEMDGFSELRNALLLVDPFDTPLGRDATRHQLLITAAQKLRNLADENQDLLLRLSALPTPVPEARIPHGMTAQHPTASGAPWPSQGCDMAHLVSMTPPPLHSYENTAPGWSESPPPCPTRNSCPPSFPPQGHQPYDTALGSPFQIPPVTDMRRFR